MNWNTKPVLFIATLPEEQQKYANDFDHNLFELGEYQQQEHTVFVSEYNAPDDLECDAKKKGKIFGYPQMVIGGNKVSVEKSF